MDRFAMASQYRAEHLNELEAERRLAEMNGEIVPPEPLEGDTDETGQYIYTRVGTTSWGSPIMKWKRWGIRA